jgi:hypothetical protein
LERRTHETREPLEGSRDSDVRVDLDEDALGGVDVDLESASFVERRVEERQEALRTRQGAHATKRYTTSQKGLLFTLLLPD